MTFGRLSNCYQARTSVRQGLELSLSFSALVRAMFWPAPYQMGKRFPRENLGTVARASEESRLRAIKPAGFSTAAFY